MAEHRLARVDCGVSGLGIATNTQLKKRVNQLSRKAGSGPIRVIYGSRPANDAG